MLFANAQGGLIAMSRCPVLIKEKILWLNSPIFILDGVYAKTLRMWLGNLESNKELIFKNFGDELYIKYRKYFKLLILGFEKYQSMDLYILHPV